MLHVREKYVFSLKIVYSVTHISPIFMFIHNKIQRKIIVAHYYLSVKQETEVIQVTSHHKGIHSILVQIVPSIRGTQVVQDIKEG